jgi:hypothetical protein
MPPSRKSKLADKSYEFPHSKYICSGNALYLSRGALAFILSDKSNKEDPGRQYFWTRYGRRQGASWDFCGRGVYRLFGVSAARYKVAVGQTDDGFGGSRKPLS